MAYTLASCAMGGGGTGTHGGVARGGSAQVIINVFGKPDVSRQEYEQKAEDLHVPPVLLDRFLAILSEKPIPSPLVKETLKDMAENYDKLRVQILLKTSQYEYVPAAKEALYNGDFEKIDAILRASPNIDSYEMLGRLSLVQADYERAAQYFYHSKAMVTRELWVSTLRKLALVYYSQERPGEAKCVYIDLFTDSKTAGEKAMLSHEVTKLTGIAAERVFTRNPDCIEEDKNWKRDPPPIHG